MTTFRAAYYVTADRQSDILLTTADDAHLNDNELIAAAHTEAANAGLDLNDGGELVIGDYTDRWAA